MPELAAAYAVGFVACLALTILYVVLRDRRRNSVRARFVQAHLAQLNLYWSDSAEAIVPLTAHSASEETSRSRRSIGLTGLIMSLLSWPGFLFLLIIMLSERFLARSRRERKLFSSKLASAATLEREDVQRTIDELDLSV